MNKPNFPVRFWRVLSEFAQRKHEKAQAEQEAKAQRRGVALQKGSVLTVIRGGK